MRGCSIILTLIIGVTAHAQEFTQRYELVNLGGKVNSFYHDAAPVVSRDGKDVYFFVQNHPENTFGAEGSQDIWVTHKNDDGSWSPAEHLGAPFNQHRSNQVFTALPDGSLFIRGGRGRKESGFSIVSPGGAWNEFDVVGFDEMNKGRFNGAAISSDAKHMILYFSELANSIRSSLYVSNLQPDGKWSRPMRLNISDRSDEYGPFIGTDDKSLYFASDRNGPNGQGGSDIFKCTRLDDTWQNWSEPVNLGRPINTAAGDAYFSMDGQGNVFTSRANSNIDGGNLDLFILLPKDIKVMVNGTVYDAQTNQKLSVPLTITVKGADPIALKTDQSGKYETRIPEAGSLAIMASATGYLPFDQHFPIPPLMGDTTMTIDVYMVPEKKPLVLEGKVLDEKTGEPVDAKVTATYKQTGTAISLATNNGIYQGQIENMGWYLLTASAEGYINATDSIEVVSDEVNPVVKDLYVKEIEVGLTVRLKNIYFDFDKTTLKSESYVELDKVVEFLNQNSSVEIEIAGHTDSKGSDEYNLNLSQGRSQAVVDYLISQGIESYRLSAHGYGETKPIDTNDTEEGRANNRRVEFTILKT